MTLHTQLPVSDFTLVPGLNGVDVRAHPAAWFPLSATALMLWRADSDSKGRWLRWLSHSPRLCLLWSLLEQEWKLSAQYYLRELVADREKGRERAIHGVVTRDRGVVCKWLCPSPVGLSSGQDKFGTKVSQGNEWMTAEGSWDSQPPLFDSLRLDRLHVNNMAIVYMSHIVWDSLLIKL